jgi:galactosamine-6-phosphate isomerase
MKIIPCSNYDEMSRRACNMLLADFGNNTQQLLCAATGNSPLGLYDNLAASFKEEPEYFRDLGIVKLDEWLGLPPDATGSCEYYLQQHLVKPLAISEDRYIGFRQSTTEVDKECTRVEKAIALWGGIDWCILGLGANGHLGFNEPGEVLLSDSHRALLSEESRQHQMILSYHEKPEYGLTLGMRAILQSRKIILLLTGSLKRQTIPALLDKSISTRLPASFLWLHPEVYCFRDMETTAL